MNEGENGQAANQLVKNHILTMQNYSFHSSLNTQSIDFINCNRAKSELMWDWELCTFGYLNSYFFLKKQVGGAVVHRKELAFCLYTSSLSKISPNKFAISHKWENLQLHFLFSFSTENKRQCNESAESYFFLPACFPSQRAGQLMRQDEAFR